MYRVNKVIILFFSMSLLYSCQPSSEEKCVLSSDIKINLKFSSLENSIPSIKTKQELIDFLSHHIALRDIFFGRKNYPNDSVFINQLYKRFTHPAFDTLLLETKKVFGDGQSLKEEFRQ